MSLIIRDSMQLPLTRGSLWDFSNLRLGISFGWSRIPPQLSQKATVVPVLIRRRLKYEQENIKQPALWAHATPGDLFYIWLLCSTDP